MVTKFDYANLEKKYWDMVENNSGQRTQVEYAADIATNKFGSGFERSGLYSQTQKSYADHPWNLNNIPKAYNSLM